MKVASGLLILIILSTAVLCAADLTARQKSLLEGARSCLGDRYDAAYYTGGPPPKGRGACTEVLYYAFLRIGIDLQDRVDHDIISYPRLYPSVRDRNIDYRWCPNLVVWFKGYARSLTRRATGKSLNEWQPGDVVFWSWSADHVADHCGIISDRNNSKGVPLVIHNIGPRCAEDDVLRNWEVVGHFRY